MGLGSRRFFTATGLTAIGSLIFKALFEPQVQKVSPDLHISLPFRTARSGRRHRLTEKQQ